MNKKSILALTVLAAFAVASPFSAVAASKKAAAAAGDKSEKGDKSDASASKPIPYHGKVASVDAAAKTFTIKGKQKDRVFTVTDKTTIMKDGAAADITAITAGEEVQGSATKTGDNWEALKVTIGAKAGKGAKKEEAAKAGDTGATPPTKPAEAGPAPGAGDSAAPAPAAPAAPSSEPPAKDGKDGNAK